MDYTDVAITNLEHFDDFHIIHKGLVFSNIVVGANFVKDAFAKFNDVMGGRTSGYESTYDKAMDKALIDLQKKAFKLGANAIVKVDFEFNGIGKNNTILAVHAVGTAVLLKEKHN